MRLPTSVKPGVELVDTATSSSPTLQPVAMQSREMITCCSEDVEGLSNQSITLKYKPHWCAVVFQRSLMNIYKGLGVRIPAYESRPMSRGRRACK